MQRTWATGSEHDRGPMEWLAAIGEETKVAEHLRAALDAATDTATIAQCETALLAIECVTYLHGGNADMHPLVHGWIRELTPAADEALRTEALAVLARLPTSALAEYWRTELSDRYAAWDESIANLRERLIAAKRAPDPRTDPRIVAFATSFETAKDHLRVALVPYEITDEPIVHVRVAPNLSVVVHYAEVGALEPLAVPIEHARAWNRSAAEIAELAARRTREVSGLRTHTIENPGFEINLAFGTSSFTAGLMPYADLLLVEGDAPHGMLVAAPNAGTVIYHKIVDAKWNEAAVEVITQTRELYAKSAEHITPQLWWWRAGEMIELPYAVVAENVMIEPVPAFVTYIQKARLTSVG